MKPHTIKILPQGITYRPPLTPTVTPAWLYVLKDKIECVYRFSTGDEELHQDYYNEAMTMIDDMLKQMEKKR